MPPLQRWYFPLALAFGLFVALCHLVSADLTAQYCSDINTSGNAKNTSIYQSNGLCYTFCNGYAFAIVQDKGCWCSNYVPGTTTSGCDETCPGYPPELCGSLSNDLYGYIALPNTPSGTPGGGGASTTSKSVTVTASPVTVFQTITSSNDSSSDRETSSSSTTSKAGGKATTSSTTSTWTPTPVVLLETVTGQVRTVTFTPTVPPNSQNNNGVTKSSGGGGLGTGGAVGLTVGLVALLAIIGGIVWFCFRKRKVENAKEYNDMNSRRGSGSGLGGPIPSRSMSENSGYVLGTDGRQVVEGWETASAPGSKRNRLMPVDPRLDPFAPVYQRGSDNKSRESVNTIRDDHDYSRRFHQQAPVLRATNPDAHTGVATDAVRDQVMRHNPNSAVYNGAYINERVPFDVLSAVLERPSADGILRMLTHMSLMRDPRAPVHVPDDVLAALPPDPDIVALEQQREELKAGAYRIQGTEIEAEVRRLTAEIGSARTRRRNIVSEEYRADYFRRRPIEDIEKQNNGQQEEEYIEPVVAHQIPERTQLAELLCSHVAGITPQEIVKRRIHSAGLMLTLCHRREVPRRYRLRATLPQRPLVKEESPDLEPFPLLLAKTQCPVCIGDELKSYEERMGCFCRVSKMRDHVERIHLRGVVPEEPFSCRHPVCKSQTPQLVLKDLQAFKNHVQTIHGVSLRP